MAVWRRGEQSPLPPGRLGQASVDGVLEYAGVAHPSLSSHLLATFGVLLISLGSLHTGPLLPLPLYGCWSALTYDHFTDRQACTGRALLQTPPDHDRDFVWLCGADKGQMKPYSWIFGCLVFVRVASTVASGICMDVLGRRRVAVVSMATYFIFAFLRSFSPVVEVAIIAVVLASAAAEAAVVALVLIAVENSVQKECVRSACLVLLGHSLAMGLAAVIHYTITGSMWLQLAKSIPAVGFIILMCWLPESVRWMLCCGDWVDAGFLFPRTHNIQLDEIIKPKLIAVQRECEHSLVEARCGGSTARRSVCPMFKTWRLARVWLLGAPCALVYGLTVGIILPFFNPFASIPDRMLALGCTELLALVLLGLLLGRLSSQMMVPMAFMSLALFSSLTTIPTIAEFKSCGLEVFLWSALHSSAAVTGIALIVSLWRICPTHSRGVTYAFVWLWAVFAFAAAAPISDFLDSMEVSGVETELKVFVCAIACLLTAVLGMLLPFTPRVLPDALSHLRRHPIDLDGSHTDDLHLRNI